MKFYKLLCIFFAICFFNSGFAQIEDNNPKIQFVDVIKLRGGIEFRGKIVKYLHNQFVSLKLPNGEEMNFSARDVKSITQERFNENGEIIIDHKPKRQYAFKESGLYKAFHAGLLGGGAAGSGSTSNVLGSELSIVIGHQFNRWIGLGLGTGVTYFYPGAGEGTYPIFIEARGYLSKAIVAPYYSVSTGYGFAFKNEGRNILEAEGGLMFHPAIGFRIGASSDVNFTVDMGVKFQNASYTRPTWDWGWGGNATESTITHHMYYKRFDFRVGLVF